MPKKAYTLCINYGNMFSKRDLLLLHRGEYSFLKIVFDLLKNIVNVEQIFEKKLLSLINRFAHHPSRQNRFDDYDK